MATGKVKWFNNAKGYGFITPDDVVKTFAHFSSIRWKALKHLNKVKVNFEITDGPKGKQASNITSSVKVDYIFFIKQSPKPEQLT